MASGNQVFEELKDIGHQRNVGLTPLPFKQYIIAMTTIAADSKGMASDSCIQTSAAIISLNAKKIQRIKGCLVGWAGSCAVCQQMINNLENATDAPVKYLTDNATLINDGVTLLILDKAGVIWEYDGRGAPYHLNEKFATIGSGDDIAMAALMSGATVQKAIRIAIQLDVGSGGKMKYVKL